MIPNPAAVCHRESQLPTWQKLLAQAIRDPAELLALLGLTAAELPDGVLAGAEFPLRVPRGYAARMRRGDARDPLLLQVLPRGAESDAVPGFGLDPVGDNAANQSPGLLHKYQGRVLLVTTGACPVHCRYCFRRHFPYDDNVLTDAAWAQAVEHIAADASIHEVILSGGDPLTLSNDKLRAIGARLAAIPHLRRLRIHTRMPVVLPERVDAGLLAWIESLPWQTVVVLHSNHTREIDAAVRAALRALAGCGATLLNQAVLLRGVNDTAETLQDLSETLFTAGVLPYYLHLLDKVAGAAHFEVPENEALALMTALQGRLPGYLVPRLVREEAGAAAKIPLTPASG